MKKLKFLLGISILGITFWFSSMVFALPCNFVPGDYYVCSYYDDCPGDPVCASVWRVGLSGCVVYQGLNKCVPSCIGSPPSL